ncbi:MAG TPA: serine hydrolase [Methylomirabilota bacterium]|nr:serine hydrolase [Methylomirabilota bacterium]
MTEPPPRFASGGYDAGAYGQAAGYPIGDRATFQETRSLVGSLSHLDEIFVGRAVRKAPAPSRLVRVKEPHISWTFEGAELTIDDYLAHNPTTGLLLARGDTILVERYQYGRTDRDRLTSFSMAKTVTAMLVGIATAEGRIRSIDDLAGAYVPELAATEYGRTSLRHLLQMSSGVRFSEVYDGHDDMARFVADTYRRQGPGGPSAVASFNQREAPPGTRFSYASPETQVLGLVLARATGEPVAQYLEQKVWQPMGAEADATWLIDNAGQEATYVGLNAVLRDYARFGLVLAHDGNWHGRQIIPASWIIDATTVRDDQPHLRPGTATPVFG